MATRIRIWNAFTNVKYKALYAGRCAEYADLSGRVFSIVLALTTAGSIASWWIWQQYAGLWAVIAGGAQVLQIIKPYLPFLGTEKDHYDSSYRYERLCLDYELLWTKYGRGSMNDEAAEQELYKLRVRERDIDERHVGFCPKTNKLKEETWTKVDAFMRLNFPGVPQVPKEPEQQRSN
jgi:hypothetical protein